MTSRARTTVRLAVAGLCGALIVLAAVVHSMQRAATVPAGLPSRPASERPSLLLLTTLPIVFSDSFDLKSSGSPALRALESRYRVEPIGVADGRSLGGHKLLFMAHALPQPAEALVDLDSWVRRGSHLLLLADPLLEWPSDRPLGDPLRPPIAFYDTGLLAHWGLRLDPPTRRGPVERQVEGRMLMLDSPGTLSGRCPTAGGGLIAHCTIGRGAVTIIADADLLQPAGAKADQQQANLDFILAELRRVEPR